MPLPKEHTYTIDDIYNLPEGHRAELIDGQIYDMAPPSTAHQRILSFLHLEIGSYIRNNNGACEVIPAPFAVFLHNENESDLSNYLEPDISIICDSDKIDDKGCHGAPDWIIEIVLPSSRRLDYYTKLSLYRANGVREYWIVDPMKRTILLYDTEHDAAPVIYSFTDIVKVNIYDDLEIDFSKLHI
ncbi:MAG: Uma2 family endonuclease [Roseburia sp.]|nr:Uma2 family endonuclease [Roseburia sp.]